MITKEKIKEVFDYFDIQSSVDSEFGDWIVSNNADVINVGKGYPIYTYQVEHKSIDDWLDHMRDKSWFDTTEESNFQKAYERAEEILGK